MLVHEVVDKTDQLNALMKERVLLLDGATGTQIQALGIEEADVRGEQFAEHHKDLKNFGDLLCVTRPEAILEIHRRYLTAGADIIETNTFGASPVGMLDFEFAEAGHDPVALCHQINRAAVELARQACEEFTEQDPSKPKIRCRFDRTDLKADGHLDQCRRSKPPRRRVQRDGRFVSNSSRFVS